MENRDTASEPGVEPHAQPDETMLAILAELQAIRALLQAAEDRFFADCLPIRIV